MKDFKKFLEEVTIKGNPGVPGEGEKQPGDKDYIKDTEARAKARLGLSGRENPMQFGGRLMELLQQSQQATRGHEEELENLAMEIITQNYGEILDNVELDIKLLRSGSQIAQFMKDCEEEQDDSEEEAPKFRQIQDPATINKIHKAKLGNNIIQGEAKNTKNIIAMQEVKDGLIDIFGPQAEQILNMWKEMSNLADKMDWIIPIEVKADMMERAPQGMAGAVSVDWKPKQKEEAEEKEEESDEDFTARILNDLAAGDEPDEEDKEEFSEEVQGATPRIRARGIDFPMLIHETVKGIYELIASIQFPAEGSSEEEIKMAQTVKLNVSSFEDEAEDFRTGPEIAADFRDFINANPEAEHPNMRAFIFGKLMDSSYISDADFLQLFRGILNKTPEARRKIDEMIDEINKELNNYELGQVIDVEEPSYDFDDNGGYEEDEDTMMPGKAEPEFSQQEAEIDYSELTQRELTDLIDAALDKKDFKRVEMLAQYMKEGKEIYLKELERINEGHNFHTRRK
jgi:hypothetical protein